MLGKSRYAMALDAKISTFALFVLDVIDLGLDLAESKHCGSDLKH